MKKSLRFLLIIFAINTIACTFIAAQPFIVKKGHRPPINLATMPVDAYEAGILSIKITPEAAKYLLQGNNKQTGIAALDLLNAENGAIAIRPLFDVIMVDKKNELKHKAWGFDLWYTISFPANADIPKLIKSYTALAKWIAVAEPRFIKVADYVPNDTMYVKQWHYNNTGTFGGIADKDIDLPEAWDIEKGQPNIIVAVVDGGIDTTHPDLSQNLWISGTERFGFNFINNTTTLVADNHGTHVAGTIGAVNNNTSYVSGVAGGDGTVSSGIRMMSCQVFQGNTSAANFAAPYIWAADRGAAIAQSSWSYNTADYYEISVLDAIDYFIANGGGATMDEGLVFFTSGNTATNVRKYPASYHRSVSVAATDNTDTKAWYSTFGITTDISAPGGETNLFSGGPIVDGGQRGVFSTLPMSAGAYGYNQGTSMACPHVSGVAALVASKAQGRLSADDIRSVVLNEVDNIYPLNPTFVGFLGKGRLNAHYSLQKTVAIMTLPVVDAVTAFKIDSFNCSNIYLSWNNNANNQVMIAVSTTFKGLFGVPTGSYTLMDTIDGGGKVIYMGNGTNVVLNTQDFLQEHNFVYFKIWSVASGNYSMGKLTFESLANLEPSQPIPLPLTEGFNNELNSCVWKISFSAPLNYQAIGDELMSVTSGINPATTPIEGSKMLQFKSYTYSGIEAQLISAPIITENKSIDVKFRWNHDLGYPTDYDSVTVKWSGDNGLTWQRVANIGRLTPSGTANGWSQQQVSLPSAAINNTQIRVGLFFTSKYGNNCYLDDLRIFHTKTNETDNLTHIAVSEFTDNAGWTNYNDTAGNRLLSVKKNGNNIGKVGNSGFSLVTSGNSGYSIIAATPSNYVPLGTQWAVMNRHFTLTPTTEPLTDCEVRFYYTADDSVAIAAAAATFSNPVANFNSEHIQAYKVNDINAAYNSNPSNGHLDIPAAAAYDGNGAWKYTKGVTSSPTEWAYGQINNQAMFAGFTVGHFGAGGLGTGTQSGNPLPVRWLSFTAELDEKNQVSLNWSVQENAQTRDYSVAISLDGRNFSTIGNVDASKEQLDVLHYSFHNLLNAAGTYYFRIQQNDLNGNSYFSETRIVTLITKQLVTLAPNPAENYVKVNGLNKPNEVRLMALDGKLLNAWYHVQDETILDISLIPAGTYLIEVLSGEIRKTYKVSKK